MGTTGRDRHNICPVGHIALLIAIVSRCHHCAIRLQCNGMRIACGNYVRKRLEQRYTTLSGILVATNCAKGDRSLLILPSIIQLHSVVILTFYELGFALFIPIKSLKNGNGLRIISFIHQSHGPVILISELSLFHGRFDRKQPNCRHRSQYANGDTANNGDLLAALFSECGCFSLFFSLALRGKPLLLSEPLGSGFQVVSLLQIISTQLVGIAPAGDLS